MSGQRYTPEFKDEAVKQVVERGYSVAIARAYDSKRIFYLLYNSYKSISSINLT